MTAPSLNHCLNSWDHYTGLGELLLVDALTRAQRIYTEGGGIGLFVDAIYEHAATYYQRFGFVASPDNPLLLFLSARVMV